MKNLREVFGNNVEYKSNAANELVNFLSVPIEIKKTLIKKFTKDNGVIDSFELSNYIKQYVIQPQDFNLKLLEARHSDSGSIELLTKLVVSFDYTTDSITCELPDFGFPRKSGECVCDYSLLSKHKKYLLNPNGCYGIVNLEYNCGYVEVIDFEPLDETDYDLNSYCEKSGNYSLKEWLSILINSFGLNAEEMTTEQQLTYICRFIPFVEKRTHFIEACNKGTIKSTTFGTLSKHSWLIGGGQITRATSFYNATTKKAGYLTDNKHSVVAFDEIQTMQVKDSESVAAAMKSLFESGNVKIGNFSATSDVSCALLGNIPVQVMNTDKNMMRHISPFFCETALLDRFSFINEGWKIPRFNDSLKFEGLALSTEYVTEMFEKIRNEFYFDTIVSQLLEFEKGSDIRNANAIRKNCSALMKILMPWVKTVEDVNVEDFEEIILPLAIGGRENVLKQLRLLDDEYKGVKMPFVSINKKFTNN